jgi:hypothetical protein
LSACKHTPIDSAVTNRLARQATPGVACLARAHPTARSRVNSPAAAAAGEGAA